MADTIAGFLFWNLDFDKNGAPAKPDTLVQFRNEVKGNAISDLFMFSHGWNNDQFTARRLYENFFGEMRKILNQRNVRSSAPLGTAGVFWPSILGPDRTADDGGGAASFSEASVDICTEMKKVFQERLQQESI